LNSKRLIDVNACFSGSNSAVECQLPKLDVAGSIPVSRFSSQELGRTTIPAVSVSFQTFVLHGILNNGSSKIRIIKWNARKTFKEILNVRNATT
jgi:hypothetical protein